MTTPAEKIEKPEDPPPTAHDVLRYATEQLHAIRPQPALMLIGQVLSELKAKLTAPPEVEEPPKDFAEAVSRIEAKIGKMEKPPKDKPDFKPILEAAKPPPVEELHKADKLHEPKPHEAAHEPHKAH